MEILLTRLRDDQIHGLNVTIPHKADIIPLLDELTPAAKTIGAVNTIFKKEGKLIGDNTDAPGFWTDIKTHLNLNTPINQNALILGAGGSARAVAYALLTRGYRVTVAARRLEQAEGLCSQFSASSDRLSVSELRGRSLVAGNWSLVINTTPVGMHPHWNASPWPPGTPFPEAAAFYDLVYNPPETLLVKRAREAGLAAVSGLGMLIEQAALAFERWTGLEPPREVMLGAVSGSHVPGFLQPEQPGLNKPT
jgi:shikimate dehydrogenase